MNASESLVRQDVAGEGPHAAAGVPWLLITAAGLILAFLLAPWPLSHKAHAMLHGLCAQRPSHSFALGGQPLPFDARMTGIYGGFAMSTLYLIGRGRFRAFRFPAPGVAILLGAFVAVLAADGMNAFLVDIGRNPLYEPDNLIRLATGLLTGISLAVGLCYMTATTLWRRGDWSRRTVTGFGEVLLLVVAQAPFAVAVASGAGWLWTPVALVLVGSAAAVVGSIVLNASVLMMGRDRSFSGYRQVQGPAAVALVAGVVFMAGVAAGRFWLEHRYGLKTLP
jgi:uncharacterized membrane protein